MTQKASKPESFRTLQVTDQIAPEFRLVSLRQAGCRALTILVIAGGHGS